ncbi:hypothetical protein Srufu_047630 [Streptomyces libani subsp. rufus]|nr:hypothetical protein Srufu_047630 [Streptomyces libani subsp. rufus]
MAATAALVLAGAGIMTAAGTAQAAEVSYKTECLPPPISGLPPIQGTTKVAVSAPATAKVGEEIEVVWKTVEGASKNPDILDLGRTPSSRPARSRWPGPRPAIWRCRGRGRIRRSPRAAR